MSENKQLYLKEDEVEHVITALSGSTSARDLAEAIGRSEEEVVAVIQAMREEKQPPSEIDLLREQNALLQRQIEELKGKGSWRPQRRQIRIFAAAFAALLLILGVWTMMITTQARALTPSPPAQENATGTTLNADTAGPFSSDGVTEIVPDAGMPAPEAAAITPPPARATSAGAPTAP